MEQYIKYETAKTCKEKGIDLPHTHYYIYPYREAFTADGSLKKNAVPDDYHDVMFQVVSTRKNQPQIAPAYTQEVLKRYLREIHNIYVDAYWDICPYNYDKVQHYTNWGYINGKDKDGNQNVDGSYDEYSNWENYEDALEFGLQQALMMI